MLLRRVEDQAEADLQFSTIITHSKTVKDRRREVGEAAVEPTLSTTSHLRQAVDKHREAEETTIALKTIKRVVEVEVTLRDLAILAGILRATPHRTKIQRLISRTAAEVQVVVVEEQTLLTSNKALQEVEDVAEIQPLRVLLPGATKLLHLLIPPPPKILQRTLLPTKMRNRQLLILGERHSPKRSKRSQNNLLLHQRKFSSRKTTMTTVLT